MKERLIIVGLSSTAKLALSFIKYYDLFDVVGFAVNKEYKNTDNYAYEEESYPVFELENLANYKDKFFDKVFVAMLWNKLNSDRKKVYEQVKSLGLSCANLISPTSRIRGNLNGDNCWLHDFVIIQDGAEIGNDVMIMANVMIGSGAKVGSHCFFGTKSTLAGGSVLGEQSFVGINATIFDDTQIGKKCIIGACTAVNRNMPDYSVCKINRESLNFKVYSPEVIETKLIFSKNVR